MERVAMTLRSILLLVLNIPTHYAWLLPSPRGVSMESVNMRHLIKWRPQQSPCSTTVYSVQFQGEFERTVLNGSWEDVPECQQVGQSECDLTLDLGSDSDYNVRVRAECGRRVSQWAKLGRPFNRKETVLTVPSMTMTAMGDALQVAFKDLPLTVGVTVTFWKSGEEQRASTHVITVEHNPFHIAALQEGAVYCARAQAHLGTSSRSNSTDIQCVSIAGPGPNWLQTTAVSVAMVILAGLVFAVFWSIIHCNPEACHAYFRREPLPTSLCGFSHLLLDWPITRPYSKEELCEPIHTILLISQHSLLIKQTEPLTNEGEG